jgi:polyhydroxyalkanoate synthesis regulator phasin
VRDEIRRMALITSGVVELTRNRAEAIVRDLIKSGELPGGQATQVVKDLMERSKQNRNEILNLVRTELRNQIEAVGLASKRDIERLERRVARLEDRPTAPTTAKKTRKSTKKSHKKSSKKTHKKSVGKTTERSDHEG